MRKKPAIIRVIRAMSMLVIDGVIDGWLLSSSRTTSRKIAGIER